MKKHTLYYFTFSLVSMVSYGQKMFTTTDAGELLTLEYNNYLNINAIQLDSKAVVIDFTSLIKDSNIGFGMGYTNHKIDFENYDRFHDYNAFTQLHSIEVYANYRKAIANNWDLSLTFAPYISSTFTEELSSEDVVLSYAAHVIKTWDNDGLKSSLKLGAGYGSLFGKPNFYPLITYSKEVNETLKYEIGIPTTGVFYKLNTQSSFDLIAQPESFYTNNASGFSMISDDIVYNSKLKFQAINVALGYNFQFDENWSTHFNMGYLMANELSISNDYNKIYDFDSSESLSLSIGISFNINNK